MARTTFDYDIVDAPSDARIVFSGPPGRLTGRLPLRNEGGAHAVLRHATVTGAQLAEAAVATVRTTVLRPRMARTLRARVAVAANTPPGEYECEVEIGGSVRPALLRVAEVVDVVVSPGVLFVENRPGPRITKRVIVENRGNVPIAIGHPGAIVLDDERGECRVTRATYEALGQFLEAEPVPAPRGRRSGQGPVPDELTFERAFAEWVKQGHQHLASVGPLGVRNAAGTTVVEGGAEAEVTFTIRVPAGLDRHTRYFGSFPIYDADLGFVVVPAPPAGGESPEEDDDESS